MDGWLRTLTFVVAQTVSASDKSKSSAVTVSVASASGMSTTTGFCTGSSVSVSLPASSPSAFSSSVSASACDSSAISVGSCTPTSALLLPQPVSPRTPTVNNSTARYLIRFIWFHSSCSYQTYYLFSDLFPPRFIMLIRSFISSIIRFRTVQSLL